MASFDNITKKIGEAAGVVASATEKALNNGKTKYNIAVEENRINKCYKELGKIYFEIAKSDENAEETVKELINVIENSLEKIEELNREIDK